MSGLDTYSALREVKDAGRMGTYCPLLLALDTLIYLRYSERCKAARNVETTSLAHIT
jgi:hypothetical protein